MASRQKAILAGILSFSLMAMNVSPAAGYMIVLGYVDVYRDLEVRDSRIVRWAEGNEMSSDKYKEQEKIAAKLLDSLQEELKSRKHSLVDYRAVPNSEHVPHFVSVKMEYRPKLGKNKERLRAVLSVKLPDGIKTVVKWIDGELREVKVPHLKVIEINREIIQNRWRSNKRMVKSVSEELADELEKVIKEAKEIHLAPQE